MSENRRGQRMKYKTILLDPPWNERGAGKIKRGANKHYNLMTLNEIKTYLQINLHNKINDDAHCYMWVTNNFLKDGLDLLEWLGFRYITNICWAKNSIGLGQYFRGQHELCLFGVKGKLPSQAKPRNVSSLITASKRKHSQKPLQMYTNIERTTPGPRVELFSRHKREGWDVIGNEAPKEEQKLLRV